VSSGGGPITQPGEPTPVGGYLLADEPIEINVGRPRTTLTVRNTGDRPIQVGSHFHFFETNAALRFDRDAAYGMRLNIAAGTAVRFEPGQARTVELVALSGDRIVYGFLGEIMGKLDRVAIKKASKKPAQKIPAKGKK